MTIIFLLQMVAWFGFVSVWMARSSQSSLTDPPATWRRTNQLLVQEQEEEQRVINNVIQLITDAQHSLNINQSQQRSRLLQEQNCSTTAGAEDECVLQPPEDVCEKYINATAGRLTCTCSRFGSKDTQVDCDYVSPQCNSDNTTCYSGSISQIFDVALKSRAVTTCTTFLQSVVETVPLNSELCIRIFPFENGNYETLSSCSTSLQLESGDGQAKVCNSCSICDKPNTDGSTGGNTTTINPNISFNCCNVLSDIQQTCAPVTAESGIAVPQFDLITPEKQGTCTSHGHRHLGPVTKFTLVRMLLKYSCWLSMTFIWVL